MRIGLIVILECFLDPAWSVPDMTGQPAQSQRRRASLPIIEFEQSTICCGMIGYPQGAKEYGVVWYGGQETWGRGQGNTTVTAVLLSSWFQLFRSHENIKSLFFIGSYTTISMYSNDKDNLRGEW